MAYSGEGVNALACALDEFRNAKIVYIETKLKRVLKCLAFYPEFREVLKVCNKNFNYAAEKSKALVRINDRNTVRLPSSKTKLVAFVSLLLLDLDRGGSNEIVSFSNAFFPDINDETSFVNMFENIVVPFKNALFEFVRNGVSEEDLETQAIPVQPAVELAPSDIGERTEKNIVRLYTAVDESALSEKARSEILFVIEALASAIDARDAKTIKAIWLGLKALLTLNDVCQSECAAMDESLKILVIS